MKDTRIYKRIFTLFLGLAVVFSLTACGGETANGGAATPAQSTQEPTSNDGNPQTEDAGAASPVPWDGAGNDAENHGDTGLDSRILIAYFSRAGENHGVGVIEQGNTRIIAEMIAEETGADLFEIAAVNPYPESYDECTDVAKKEQEDSARPEIVDPPENLDGYDTVFIGYPIWWGDLPMAVYTFLESYDFSGKTVIPFCTHEGSGLAETESSIKETCPGATVLDGLAIRGGTAQNQREEAKSNVTAWLDGLGI